MNTPFPENQSTKLQGHYFLSVFWVLVLTFLWMSVTGVKHHFDFPHYQTVDGNYYTELSKDFLHGRQMTISGIRNKEGKSFSPYPPGYPVLLAATDRLQPDPIVPHHIWLHGALFLIVGLVWVRYLPAWPLVLFLFADTVLELGTYNWSEFSFVVSLIMVSVLLARTKTDKSPTGYVLLLLALIGSSLIRYAAVFQILLLAVLIAGHFKKDRTHAARLFWVLAGFGIYLFGFSVWEWLTAGQVTGGDRYPNTDNGAELIHSLLLETGNQLLIFKDFSGSSAFSFRAGMVSMVVVAFFLYRSVRKPAAEERTEPGDPIPSFIKSASFHLLLMGMGYLAFIIPTRWYFYFAESYDLRLLGPGFSLIWLAFFVFLSGKRTKTLWLPLCLYVAFALFFTLPKQPIFDAYQEKFWLRTGPVFPSRQGLSLHMWNPGRVPSEKQW